MNYIKPEMKVNMFAQEEVFTEASTVPGQQTVPGLVGVDAANIRQVQWTGMKEVTKFVF